MSEKITPVFVTANQLAEIISTPVYSIYKMARARKIPSYSLNSRTYLFKVEEVIQSIERLKLK